MEEDSGEWGDEDCLNLACNVLGVNIVIAVAFQDSNLIIRSLDKPKHELFPNLTISLTKEKLDNEKARMDNLTPSTCITVISHSGASIKYPELMGQFNLVDYIKVQRKPVYRKGPNWIFYGSKSLVES